MSDPMPSVLIFLEAKNNEITRLSWEAMAAGHALAEGHGLPVNIALVGSAGNPIFETIHGKPPRTVYAIDHKLLHAYTPDGYTASYAQLIEHVKPAYVVLPHTYQVRDFAPRLATRFQQVLISDVTGIESGPKFIRQLLQGKLNAEYHHSGTGICFLSVQAGAFRADEAEKGETTLEPFLPKLEAAQIRTQPGEPFRASAQTVDLNSAAILVSVGRGIKEQANLPIVEELAKALGAELAASRPICDNGWLPMDRQVGSSGQTVAPKVYLAVGISGAIQHLVGMKGSQCIVAINKDENAPIFEVADYGIVGDLFEVVPALTAAIRKVKG
ncbi:electron transfer flavoprotein subunit alpha/FixB family protein [Acidicapsa acidisoli]|uniref:electron transfer flavoprotein subunit alpha/FixB family protein n=1 Tax=Acidicapsa acidisoli TaxID=1615681 RepID=UPI0021E0061D|nr:electron transfer flavoprotein subunit alpha/FixB family protein [Acidicapsa acidisoli]